MSERLQKILARTGVGSRRQIEQWIQEGRLTINGKTAQLGDHAAPDTKVTLDGCLIKLAGPVTKPRIILYHKPAGEICTRHDPEGRPTVFASLPKICGGRWINIGRLDVNTSGLLLFTNDGELAHKLMHPAQQIQREYAVRVLGEVDHAMLKQLTRGVKLEDGFARFEDIVESGGKGANSWFHVVLTEGRNRLVRRLWESQGVRVSRLMRVRFGSVFLTKALRPGNFSELKEAEIKKLCSSF